MDAERWNRVDDLLQSALLVPAEQQEDLTSHRKDQLPVSSPTLT
ncbi:MAG: hypothetical protein ABR881_30230 [Candidatus Sulfotelmatobacter sp.]|jgi:hypothetical protein